MHRYTHQICCQDDLADRRGRGSVFHYLGWTPITRPCRQCRNLTIVPCCSFHATRQDDSNSTAAICRNGPGEKFRGTLPCGSRWTRHTTFSLPCMQHCRASSCSEARRLHWEKSPSTVAAECSGVTLQSADVCGLAKIQTSLSSLLQRRRGRTTHLQGRIQQITGNGDIQYNIRKQRTSSQVPVEVPRSIQTEFIHTLAWTPSSVAGSKLA